MTLRAKSEKKIQGELVVDDSERIRDKSFLEMVKMRSLAAWVITASWSGGCGGMLSSSRCSSSNILKSQEVEGGGRR